MRQWFKITPIMILVSLISLGFTLKSDSSSYKCMIQMKNYSGEGAYVVISLMNPSGAYEKTLYVKGDDDEWYFDIKKWWNFYGKRRTSLDAITGATISGGERSVNIIEIEDDKLDKGYKIRFESAVEDQEYYENDVEFDLTSKNTTGKIEGNGFIRYIRMIPQN